MRPAEFTPEDIVAAGDDLVASGRSVTGFALRKKVGGGNPNRLKAVWDEYLAGKQTSRAVEQIALPLELNNVLVNMQAEVRAMINHMAIEMHQVAFQAAESRVAETMRTANEMREQAEKEMADAAQTVEQLEEELEKTKTQVTKLKTELENEHEYTTELEVKMATLKAQLTSAGEKVALEQKVDSLQAQMELLMLNMEPHQVETTPAPTPKKGGKKGDQNASTISA